MNMTTLENRILDEAKKRASQQLEAFTILPLLEPFGLDPKRIVTIKGRRNGLSNEADLRLSDLDAAIRQIIFKSLTDRIADQLLEQFLAATESVDMSGFATSTPPETKSDESCQESAQNERASDNALRIATYENRMRKKAEMEDTIKMFSRPSGVKQTT